MISLIESAVYILGPKGKLCENGLIKNLSECQKAAKQLKYEFDTEESVNSWPGGCYMHSECDSCMTYVYFNKNLNGIPNVKANPICGKGKYGKHFIKILEH